MSYEIKENTKFIEKWDFVSGLSKLDKEVLAVLTMSVQDKEARQAAIDAYTKAADEFSFKLSSELAKTLKQWNGFLDT